MNNSTEDTPIGSPKRSPLKMIREHCIDCSGGSPSEVKKCPVKRCSLWEFRFGTSPYRKGTRPDVSTRKEASV